MKTGVCKLCLQSKPLVKAHIYPQFMYEPSMFDEKNRMVLIEENNFLKDETFKQQQTGFWDGNILCTQCDNVTISKYESYGRFLLYGGIPNQTFKKPEHHIISKNDFDFIKFHNVDYELYKCFLLSLLWRASISGLEWFKGVDLGKIHNERIRNYLITGDPGPEDHYEIALFSIRAADIFLKDIVTNGYTYRMKDGGRIISIFIGGLGYIFAIGALGQRFPDLLNQCTPKKSMDASIISFKSNKGRDLVLRMTGLHTFTKLK